MEKYKKIDLFTLELGRELCTDEKIDKILKIISALRKEIFDQLGVALPTIRIKSNFNLKPGKYVIKVSEIKAASFEIKNDSLLIVDIGNVKSAMKGEPAKDPVFQLDAIWIPCEKEALAQKKGYFIISFEKIIKTHLKEIIKNNITSVITTQYVNDLLDEIAVENEALCSQIAQKFGKMSYAVVKEVLQSLLHEDVSIKNIIPILEGLCETDYGDNWSIKNLTEKARFALAPDIISGIAENRRLNLIKLEKNLMEYLFAHSKDLENLVIDDKVKKLFSDEFSNIIERQESNPVVLCIEPVRHEVEVFVKDICLFQEVKVISDMELYSALRHIENLEVNIVAAIGEKQDKKSKSVPVTWECA